MAQLDKIGSYELMVEPFHVDLSGHLSLPVLGNHLLNAAGCHASDRGFGINQLNAEHFTWVLSRLVVEIIGVLPYQYEPFSIQTWIENIYRLFTDRNFSVTNKDGQVVAYARSVWAMIDTGTRKPVDLMTIHGDIAEYICDRECPIAKPSRIKVGNTEAMAEQKVRYSDLDVNGHVNSIRYIEHALDLFPTAMYRVHRLKRFEVAYVAETVEDDTMCFFMEPVSDLVYDIEIRKNGSEDVACRLKMIFE